jgi:hypothetical protein
VRKGIVFIAILVTSSALFGQTLKTPNYRKFDSRWFHFGFMLGLNTADLYAMPTTNTALTPGLVSFNTKSYPGFNLGIISSFKLGHPTLSLRIIPSLSFLEREVNYHFIDAAGEDEFIQRKIESTNLDFPLLIKYRTLRYNNFAAYFVGGVQYTLDLQSKQDVAQIYSNPFLKLKKHDFQGQLGVGVDFFLPYFKFGFEIKMSHSIINNLYQDNNRLSNPFDRLYNRVVWFSLTFEG